MVIQHILGIILNLTILSFLHYPFIEGYCLENVALGKPATQSTVNYKGYALRAVDGNRDQYYWSHSCTYAHRSRPFWQVDLQAEYTIRAVTITNRANNKATVNLFAGSNCTCNCTLEICISMLTKEMNLKSLDHSHPTEVAPSLFSYSTSVIIRSFLGLPIVSPTGTILQPKLPGNISANENNECRLDDFDVEISTSNPLTDQNATYEKCMTFPGAFGAVTRTLCCDHLIKGRYVRIQKNNNVVLTLCEVAVHPVFEDQRDNCDTGQKRPADFIPHNEVYMRTSGFKEFSGSLMSCMVECFWLPVCDGFNFNGTGHGVGICELIPVGLGNPTAKSGWTYYEAVCN